MAELRELARVEGKAWASRLRKQLQAWDRPANDNFPDSYAASESVHAASPFERLGTDVHSDATRWLASSDLIPVLS